MKCFLLTSSIGKKLIVSLSGLFLMSFLAVHLTVNLMLIFDDTGALFNQAANFMATNPVIKIVEPLLALGFVVHIVFTAVVTLQNRRARPTSYQTSKASSEVSWASRNMFVLGGLILIFLVIHLMNFFIKMKLTGDPLYTNIEVDGVVMKNSYALVSTLFKTSTLYNLIYVVGAVFLGFHLTHGFWSAFQSIGFNNNKWIPRLKIIATVFAVLIATGFAIIPLYFMFFLR